MSRVEIPPVCQPMFSTEITVDISHINYAGHMGNDSALRLAHEARIRFLASLGCTESDVYGAGIIIADAAIIYQAEAFHADKLKIELCVRNFSRVACEFVYQATRMRDNSPILRIKTGVVFFDYASRQTSPVPGQFIDRCNTVQGE